MANIGTPLIWFGCCWLVLGNLVIGLVEARLLKNIYKVDDHRVKSTMVWANYVTAGVGVLFMQGLEKLKLDPFAFGISLLIVPWVVAFGLTVVIENLFVSHVSGLPYRSKESWRRTSVINLYTYAPLLALVVLLQGVTVLTNATLLRDARTIHAPGGWVYYLAPNREVRRIRMDGTNDEFVLAPLGGTYAIFVEPSPKETSADLVACDSWGSGERLILVERIGKAKQSAKTRALIDEDGKLLDDQTAQISFERHRKYSGELKDRPYVSDIYWAGGGLNVGTTDGKNYNLALDTPFISRAWNFETVLPGDFCVAQFGDDIVILDMKRKRLGRLVHGSSPSVLLDLDQAPDRKSSFYEP
jgi:hypothetical protein